jgi:hypothetical protein
LPKKKGIFDKIYKFIGKNDKDQNKIKKEKIKEFENPPRLNSVSSKAGQKNFIFTELDEI